MEGRDALPVNLDTYFRTFDMGSFKGFLGYICGIVPHEFELN